MDQQNLVEALIAYGTTAYPDADFSFLDQVVFTNPLNQKDQHNYLRLLSLARKLQADNAIFEPLYQRLVHLYVLNGSRLDLLKTIDRRLRGAVAGQMGCII